MKSYKLWIDGQWQDTQGGKMMTIENPATGEQLAEVIDAAAHYHDVRVDAEALADGLLAAIEGGLLLDRDKPTNPAAVAAVTHFGHYLKLTLTQGAAQ